MQGDSLPAEPLGKPKNTGVGSLSLLQRIFPTQESNLGLLHCRWILYHVLPSGINSTRVRGLGGDRDPNSGAVNTISISSVPAKRKPGLELHRAYKGKSEASQVSSTFFLWWLSKVKVKSLSRVRLFATPWTLSDLFVSPPASSVHGISSQEYWSGLPFPSPGHLPNPGIKPRAPALQEDAFPSEPPGKLPTM